VQNKRKQTKNCDKWQFAAFMTSRRKAPKWQLTNRAIARVREAKKKLG